MEFLASPLDNGTGFVGYDQTFFTRVQRVQRDMI